jgi:hypothetical protein
LEGTQWGRPGPGGTYWRDSAVTGQNFFDKMVSSNSSKENKSCTHTTYTHANSQSQMHRPLYFQTMVALLSQISLFFSYHKKAKPVVNFINI